MLLSARLARAQSAATLAALQVRNGVLSEESIKAISSEADRGVHDLPAFTALRAAEARRADPVHPGQTPVSIPNGDGTPLLSLPVPSPEEVQSHFRLNKVPSFQTGKLAAAGVEKLISNLDRSKVVAQISLWGCKTFADAAGEVDEVLGLLGLLAKTCQGDLLYNFQGAGKHALVLPATNFPLLALKDIAYLALQGFKVTLAVQPRYFRIYADIRAVWPHFDLLPLVTRPAEQALLSASTHVAALRFTGNSKLFKQLVTYAVRAGNVDLDYGGEISGINKTVIADSVSAAETDPVVVQGLHWSITANNGELCSSTSVVESGLSADRVAKLAEAILARDAQPEMYGDWSARLLRRADKQAGVNIEETSAPREYWDKTAQFAPLGHAPTHDALTHCVYAATLREALTLGVTDVHASNVYVCATGGLARVGTTGAKIPEAIFGSMKTYTNSVGGNHDGVGSVQWLLSLVRMRRMQKESYTHLDNLPDRVEELLDFLPAESRQKFLKELGSITDVFTVFAKDPEVHGPYPGQPLVSGEGHTSVVGLKAIRSTLKKFLLIGAPDEAVIKTLAVELLSPFRAMSPPVIHVLVDQRAPQLQDPLKSFLRFAEKKLKLRVEIHSDWEAVAATVRSEPIAPYFYGSVKKSLLPKEVLAAVAERGGFVYEGVPACPLGVFRQHTTSQSWAAGVTEGVEEAKSLLREVYSRECLKADWKGDLGEVIHTPEEEIDEPIDYNDLEAEPRDAHGIR